MKVNELKNILKECVREVFQEEIKEIILESIKSSKQPLNESLSGTISTGGSTSVRTTSNNLDVNPKHFDANKIRNAYSDIMNEHFSPQEKTFNPNQSVDVVNGTLPEGDVPLDMIAKFIKK